MRKIVYYVAMSIDGYIAGFDGDISGFVQGGKGVEQYLEDLKDFDTVLMGRKTYEFGYQYGLVPGQLAYPHMEHYIFSESLRLPKADPKLHICSLDISLIKKLKQQLGADIYLCGGGQLANWLLEKKMIDILKIKLNPFIQGKGIKLFGSTTAAYQMKLKNQTVYDDGLQIISYDIL